MIPHHPLAELFPMMAPHEHAQLVADMRTGGFRAAEPIVLMDGAILDGRNRHAAAVDAGVKPRFRAYDPAADGDPLRFVLSRNLHRRHLDDRQRASVAGKIANFSHGGDRSKPPIGGLPVDAAAEALNVAPRQVERARVVHATGIPEVRDALDRGEVSVSLAEAIARLPEDQQRQELGLPRGARAIMSSRQEPDDSLDYFPTPPWATRALMECALPEMCGDDRDWSTCAAWEPACGEGHIAEVLREYFGEVRATDVHDYGYGSGQVDFIGENWAAPGVDWIVTNPPFGDKAEKFVLRAVATGANVAMFLRLQWLETVGRYERVFAVHPPAMIAQFAERVPLHKGRWEPKGDTATAYLWIIWMPLRREATGRTEFFWIPPGQRERLSKPDDVARFTANPVIRRENFDPETGEVAA